MMRKLLALCIALLMLPLVPARAEENAPAWQAYNGKRIGVLTGTLLEGIARDHFPDSEYLLFNSYPDCIAALLAGKIDAYLGDEPGLKSVHAEQPRIDYIHDRITSQEYSFAFRKNDPQSAALCGELNAFLAQCHLDGTMQELDDIWFGVDEDRKIVDMSDLNGDRGVVRVVTTSTDMPFSYIKDGKNVGYDIDLVVRFCRYAGYRLELGDVDFAARIPAVQSGKYDFTTDMNVTEERKEQVLFSDPSSSGGVVLAVLSDALSTEQAAGQPAGLTLADLDGKRIGVHLKKEYPQVTPLKDVSVEIRDGDVVAVIGPSGTGKSTLLRCINQLEKPTSGRVWLDGVEITDKKCDINQVRRKMGMVFQSFNLFGHLTVIENIMLSPMDLLGKTKQEAYDEGMRLLRMVGLAEKALNYPDELSGGQKQRIAIARALAMNPEVILLDEPTSALDPTMVGEVQAVIRELAKIGKTMLIVTHEMNFARAISNRVFYMDEGGIYEEGTPQQIFEHPMRENTRRFIKKLKVLELNIQSRDYDFLGMAAQIDGYCSKNQITPRLSNRIQLVFEETARLLLPRLETPTVQAICEYAEAAERAEWTLRYAGPRMDPAQSGDDLALAVLRGMTERMEYTWHEADALPNCISIVIKSV